MTSHGIEFSSEPIQAKFAYSFMSFDYFEPILSKRNELEPQKNYLEQNIFGREYTK